jgi:hypothetical protein
MEHWRGTLPMCRSWIRGSGRDSGTLPSLPRYIRSLNDLYRVTNHIDDVILYFHLVRCDLIVFEEVKRMQNQELLWIKRLVSRPIRKKPISIKWIYKEKKNVK